MLRSAAVVALVLLAFGLFAACGGGDDKASGQPDPVADPTAVSDPTAEGDPVADGDPVAEGTVDLSGDLIIYSGRREPLFEPVVEAFEKASGIDVSVKYGATTELGNALIEEKSNPRADFFIGVDAATAEELREKGVFAKFDAPELAAIDPGLRADDGTWVGVSGRARVIMYNKDLVPEAELPKSVFELTDPKWKGKVAIPATSNSSFTAWVSSLRKLRGDNATRDYLEGLKNNDVQVLIDHTNVRQAVGRGEFALGLVNHYYFELEKDAGSPVGVIYPDQGPGEIGVMFNVAAGSIVEGAKHRENAEAFMKFLVGPEAQRIFAESNFEYPLVAGVAETRAEVKRGTFRESAVNLVEMGMMNEDTLDFLDDIGLE